jgi:hypothetical protein
VSGAFLVKVDSRDKTAGMQLLRLVSATELLMIQLR